MTASARRAGGSMSLSLATCAALTMVASGLRSSCAKVPSSSSRHGSSVPRGRTQKPSPSGVCPPIGVGAGAPSTENISPTSSGLNEGAAQGHGLWPADDSWLPPILSRQWSGASFALRPRQRRSAGGPRRAPGWLSSLLRGRSLTLRRPAYERKRGGGATSGVESGPRRKASILLNVAGGAIPPRGPPPPPPRRPPPP